MKKKIGFIGAGNMATAIVSGLVSSDNFDKSDIYMYDCNNDKLIENQKKYGVNVLSGNDEIVSMCDVVIVAVKPVSLPSMFSELKSLFNKYHPLVISIAAGQSIERIQSFIGDDIHIVRVMPNINALANESMSGYAVSKNVNEDEKIFAELILNSFGKCVPVDEDLFSVYSAVAGCSPAYAYLFVDCISRVGVKYGLTKKNSVSIVLNSIKKYFLDNSVELNKNNADILLKSLEIGEFSKIIENCISSAVMKDRKM